MGVAFAGAVGEVIAREKDVSEEGLLVVLRARLEEIFHALSDDVGGDELGEGGDLWENLVAEFVVEIEWDDEVSHDDGLAHVNFEIIEAGDGDLLEAERNDVIKACAPIAEGGGVVAALAEDFGEGIELLVELLDVFLAGVHLADAVSLWDLGAHEGDGRFEGGGDGSVAALEAGGFGGEGIDGGGDAECGGAIAAGGAVACAAEFVAAEGVGAEDEDIIRLIGVGGFFREGREGEVAEEWREKPSGEGEGETDERNRARADGILAAEDARNGGDVFRESEAEEDAREDLE